MFVECILAWTTLRAWLVPAAIVLVVTGVAKSGYFALSLHPLADENSGRFEMTLMQTLGLRPL